MIPWLVVASAFSEGRPNWAGHVGLPCLYTQASARGNLCYQQQPHILGSGGEGICQGPLAAPDGGHFGMAPPMWVWTPLTVWVWTLLEWMWWVTFMTPMCASCILEAQLILHPSPTDGHSSSFTHHPLMDAAIATAQ